MVNEPKTYKLKQREYQIQTEIHGFTDARNNWINK